MAIQMKDVGQHTPTYILGHDEKELQRLMDQSRVYGELTEDFLLKAGLQSGMRVLDLGSGAGDVSLLAAKLVGPAGAVLGIERSSEAIQVARRRAQSMGLENVTFMEGDIASFSLKTPVDAVIGRLVLMYLPDPVMALRRLAEQVRPGGLIAFQEFDFTRKPTAYPPSFLFEQFTFWIVETLRRSGADTQMGLKLRQVFIWAGLPAPQMTFATRVEGGANSYVYEFMAQNLRSFLPAAEALGVVTAEEVQIETLAERLRDEIADSEGVVVLPFLVGAWTRKGQ